MHTAAALDPRSTGGRLLYAAFASSLLAAILFEVVRHGTGYWQLAAFGFGPDLALLYGAGRGLAKGQLHPRAVLAYNLVHRYWLPVGLTIVAAFGLLPLAYLVGGLMWCFHISFDRALGHSLRTPDGVQRS